MHSRISMRKTHPRLGRADPLDVVNTANVAPQSHTSRGVRCRGVALRASRIRLSGPPPPRCAPLSRLALAAAKLPSRLAITTSKAVRLLSSPSVSSSIVASSMIYEQTAAMLQGRMILAITRVVTAGASGGGAARVELLPPARSCHTQVSIGSEARWFFRPLVLPLPSACCLFFPGLPRRRGGGWTPARPRALPRLRPYLDVRLGDSRAGSRNPGLPVTALAAGPLCHAVAPAASTTVAVAR